MKRGAVRRERALLFKCPKCNANPGYACIGKYGARKAMHRERMGKRDRDTIAASTRRGAAVLFYKSDAWRAVRYEALKRCGAACQCCGAKAAKNSPLHVDHIKPRSKFPDLQLEVSNLQVLCEDCNMGKGARDQTDWRAA